jgi:hypothetical protein
MMTRFRRASVLVIALLIFLRLLFPVCYGSATAASDLFRRPGAENIG